MRITSAAALLPLASAFVIFDAEVFNNLETSSRRVIEKGQNIVADVEESARNAIGKGHQVFEKTQNALDDALEKVVDGAKTTREDVYNRIHKAGCDVESWLEGSSFENPFVTISEDHPDHPDHPHHPPPHHPPPHDGPPHLGPPPHHGKPHHPPHHGKSNLTVYELISKSNYTTKLAKLIDEYPDLVEKLNGTKANFTIFAPIDSAFEKIPHHGDHKPSKEAIEKVLLYHISDSFYPAGRVLHSYTIPTLYEPSDPDLLGHKQRLTVRVTLKGPALNFYSRIVAVNIFGTNGVIHGIDSLLIPPPNVASIINLLPGEFSTLELGLGKTGLFDKINDRLFGRRFFGQILGRQRRFPLLVLTLVLLIAAPEFQHALLRSMRPIRWVPSLPVMAARTSAPGSTG